MHCLSVEGLEYLPERNGTQGVLVLTPALGHREFLMRYLGRHYKCADYYQPHNREALDILIRRQRTAMGIALLTRSREGEQLLASRLLTGMSSLSVQISNRGYAVVNSYLFLNNPHSQTRLWRDSFAIHPMSRVRRSDSRRSRVQIASREV